MAYLDHPDRPRRIGFTSYADGTPRLHPFEDRFPAEDPEGDAAYADEALPDDAEPLEAADRRGPPRLVAFSAAALAGAALAFAGAYWIRSSHHPAPSRPQAPAPAIMAQAAPQPQFKSVAPVGSGLAPPIAPTAAPLDATAKPRPGAPSASPRHLLARLDCAQSATRAQRMVCDSPGLLALDRRVTRAYAQAKAAGAPPRMLQRDQVKWLMARETAARRSRRAVEHLYRSRLEELQARPYRACPAGSKGRSGLATLTHWLLSAPRRAVSPAAGRHCG